MQRYVCCKIYRGTFFDFFKKYVYICCKSGDARLTYCTVTEINIEILVVIYVIVDTFFVAVSFFAIHNVTLESFFLQDKIASINKHFYNTI